MPSSYYFMQLALKQEVEELESELDNQRKAQISTFKKTVDVHKRGSTSQEKTTEAGGTTDDLKRKITIMEHQLSKQQQKLSQTQAHNKQLKDQIDSLRKERLIFDKIYRNLEKELNTKKMALNKIIQEAEAAYIMRENALSNIEKTKEMVDEKRKQYEKNWQELEKMINAQSEKKAENVKEEKELESKDETKKNLNIAEMRIEESKLTEECKSNENKIQQYRETFEAIKKEIDISDIKDVTEQFSKTDQENNTLNQYVIELLKELQELESQIQTTKKKINDYNCQNSENEQLREEAKKKLEAKISQTYAQIEKSKQKYAETIKTVNALKIGIKSLYDAIVTEKGQKEESGHEGV